MIPLMIDLNFSSLKISSSDAFISVLMMMTVVFAGRTSIRLEARLMLHTRGVTGG